MRKESTILTIAVVLLSTLPSFPYQSVLAQSATLTGVIHDYGLDTDMDGLYNFLVIEVEVDVSEAGYYTVGVDALRDEHYRSEYFYKENGTQLEAGLHNVTIALEGIAIHGSRINASHVSDVSLSWEDTSYFSEHIAEIPLSETYNYTAFDIGATLTGTIFDKGIDTDGDGLHNSLQIGVELNVTDPATYEVYIYGLEDGAFLNVYNSSQNYLLPGIQIQNVSLNGARIYASRTNVSTVMYIDLRFLGDYQRHQIDDRNYLLLSRTYYYDEFDPFAFLTGVILDEGIDEDADSLYDYLQIGVEINVTDAGYYTVQVMNLLNNGSVHIDPSSTGKDFEVGTHLVNFTVYGPRIYVARVNPTYIGLLRLYYRSRRESTLIEEMYDVPLPVPYQYKEFESHAFLTGEVYDRGVDTDSDHLFDYLEVGVGVNVTEAGTYQIVVGGLEGKTDGSNMTSYISYDGEPFHDYLASGIHVINFNFSGSKIAYFHLNPTNVTHLSLRENSYLQLSYIDTAELSMTYNHTQFNSPMNNMEIEFTVYPDAQLGVTGSFNQTRAYPPFYSEPLVNATLSFSGNGDVTTGSVNGTITPPKSARDEFPLNSTSIDFVSEYYQGVLNAQLDATIAMPSEAMNTYPFNSSDFSFVAAYYNGMLDAHLWGEARLPSFYASQFPFNVSDVTILADYNNKEIEGNMTFHAVSGLPLEDVITHFNGNTTEISLAGHVDVVYGNYFGMEINATTLEEMLGQFNSTIPGQGENSLYNMTEGIIECTVLNTTKTPIGDPEIGAKIDYNATIAGNFTLLLVRYLTQSSSLEEATAYAALDSTLSSVQDASLTLNYYYGSKIASINLTLSSDARTLWKNALQSIPQTAPPEYQNQSLAWLKIANITAYAVESANIDATYSSSQRKLDLYATLTANITQLKDQTIPILPDIVPSEFRDLVESCTNTTHCTLDSLNTTCNYVNGVLGFEARWLLKGDFTSEVNRIKNCYVRYLNATSPQTVNLQMQMLNATVIDINNFQAEVRQGEDWMKLYFEGLRMHPSKDEMDKIRFKLFRFFNTTTAPDESPREFEKLTVTLTSGFNGTHTILLYAPGTVPQPDMTSLDYKTMKWENVTMSGLRDLLFKIAYQGVVSYLGETYHVPIFTNSTINDFSFTPTAKRISFNVSGVSGMGFCNITIPKALLYAEPEWTIRIDGVPLAPEDFNLTENMEYAFIYLDYSHSDHLIEIEGTWIVTEFSPNIIPLIMLAMSLIAALIVVKKVSDLKRKPQHMIRILISRLNPQKT